MRQLAYATTAEPMPAPAGVDLKLVRPVAEPSYEPTAVPADVELERDLDVVDERTETAPVSSYQPPTKDDLVREYGPLVKKVAYRIVQRVPSSVEVDDLISAGMIGLLTAADRYDPAKGAFPAFAEWRIKGAILDELRLYDHLTRTQRQKVNKLENAEKVEHRLAQELGREPTSDEIAEALELTEEQYHEARVYEQGRPMPLISSDDPESVGWTIESLLSEDPSPEELAVRSIQVERAREEFGRLTKQEQQVMILYYGEGLTYREIGALFERTESRICQIAGKARRTLAKRLQDAA